MKSNYIRIFYSIIIIYILHYTLSTVIYFMCRIIIPEVYFNPVYSELIFKICKTISLFSILFFFYKKKLINTDNNRSYKLEKKTILNFFVVFLSFLFFSLSYFNIFKNYFSFGIYDGSYLLKFLIVVILGPFIEELFYRYLLINYLLPVRNLRNDIYIFLVVLCVSLLFSLNHLQFQFPLFLSYFIFSSLITTIYIYYRNFKLIFLFHAFFNFIVEIDFYFINNININIIVLTCACFFFLTIFFLNQLIKKIKIENNE